MSEIAPPARPRVLRPTALGACAAAICVVLCAVFVAKIRGAANDDFFITYRYAANLLDGRGLVFNPGERVFGLTEPGQGIALAALAGATRAPIPWVSTFFTAAVLLAVGALLWRGRASDDRLAPALAACLLAGSSYLWASNGCGALPATAALLAAAVLAERRPILAGLLAGFAPWFRPDAGLGLAILGLLLLARGALRKPFVIASAAAVALGVALAWSYYGTPMPNTLGAKAVSVEAAGIAGAGLRFWASGAGALRNHWGALWPAVALAGAMGTALMIRRGSTAFRLLGLYGVAIAAAYPFLGVPFYPWYAVPTLIALLCGMAWLATESYRSAREKRGTVRAGGVLGLAAVGILVLGGPLAGGVRFLRRADWPPPHMAVYRVAGDWLRENTPPESSLAYVEIGIVGYYSERYVYDLMGLVSPRAIPYVAKNDVFGAFRLLPTDYVIFHTRGRMRPIVQNPWFKRRYRPVATFSEPAPGTGELVIYRRRGQRSRG
jgi:arabinofuranosyltransferase